MDGVGKLYNVYAVTTLACRFSKAKGPTAASSLARWAFCNCVEIMNVISCKLLGQLERKSERERE